MGRFRDAKNILKIGKKDIPIETMFFVFALFVIGRMQNRFDKRSTYHKFYEVFCIVYISFATNWAQSNQIYCYRVRTWEISSPTQLLRYSCFFCLWGRSLGGCQYAFICISLSDGSPYEMSLWKIWLHWTGYLRDNIRLLAIISEKNWSTVQICIGQAFFQNLTSKLIET